MDFSVNDRTETLWSSRSDISCEEVLLKALINTCFTPAPEWHAWLIFLKKNGQGIALTVGPLRPHRRQLKRAYPHVGIAEVDEKFQPLLLDEGPAGLMWNGKEVIARGH